MYPNETEEHHRDNRCRNKEVNQFCYDPFSKYRGNFCGCITRHHPVWAGSRSWVSRYLSLHLRIRGDEVRVRSCLIFRYRIWPKKLCILEKHNNLPQKYNSWRLLLTITHKYLSSHETRKHRHIIARVAAFWQHVFQTLRNLDVHPGVAVYHTLEIFSIVDAKDLRMPHTKFQVCTLKINTIFRHRKKNPITFEQECTLWNHNGIRESHHSLWVPEMSPRRGIPFSGWTQQCTYLHHGTVPTRVAWESQRLKSSNICSTGSWAYNKVPDYLTFFEAVRRFPSHRAL